MQRLGRFRRHSPGRHGPRDLHTVLGEREEPAEDLVGRLRELTTDERRIVQLRRDRVDELLLAPRDGQPPRPHHRRQRVHRYAARDLARRRPEPGQRPERAAHTRVGDHLLVVPRHDQHVLSQGLQPPPHLLLVGPRERLRQLGDRGVPAERDERVEELADRAGQTSHDEQDRRGRLQPVQQVPARHERRTRAHVRPALEHPAQLLVGCRLHPLLQRPHDRPPLSRLRRG